jgi:protein-S-isoprenylcysteine O-methyltransferase Ste14
MRRDALDTAESTVGWAGGFGALVFAILMFIGLRRGWQKPVSVKSGSAPDMLRNSPGFYVPASIVGIGLMVWIWRPLPIKLARPLRILALVVGSSMYFFGLVLMVWGRLALGSSYNVSSSLGAQLYTDQKLVTSGPFSIVRNPMYVGGLCAEIGGLLLYRTWATVITLSNIPVLFKRTQREEEALSEQFGEEWAAYSASVPAWIPRFVSDPVKKLLDR